MLPDPIAHSKSAVWGRTVSGSTSAGLLGVPEKLHSFLLEERFVAYMGHSVAVQGMCLREAVCFV